ncbi:DUF2492 family protein [Erwinia sp. CPCC 100877]|nr:DUF2492 family protein [Erwinia sp. CPCC 100877]
MSSIHGHEVLNMMLDSGERYTRQNLTAASVARFGEDARFHTCSRSGMSAPELVMFLEQRGKFVPAGAGFTTHQDKICRH